MRKILLGTTAVVGAALIATAAHAQTAPTVRVGGFMLTQMNWQSDDLDDASGVPTGVAGRGLVSRDSIDFKNEVEISVIVTGKAANGMSYGGVIEIQNDGTGGTVFDIDEAYVFVSSPTLGTLRFGEEDSAASLLEVRHPSIPTSGSSGDWDDGLLSSSAFTGGGPSLMTGVNDGNDATKIVYLSPQFFGFDFGLSYSPNRNEGDRIIGARALDSISVTAGSALSPTAPQRDGTGLTNELSAAVRYRGSFGNVGVAGAFVYQQADAPGVATSGVSIATPAQDVQVFSVGLNVTAFGFTVGGEYTWGDYAGNPGTGALAAGRDESSHWVLGLTYRTGPFQLGTFFGQAEQDNGGTIADREQQVWGISGLYNLAPGLDIYATYAQLSDDNVNISLPAVGTRPAGTLRNRDASTFLLGTRLAF